MTRSVVEVVVDGGLLVGTVDGDGPPVLLVHGGPGMRETSLDALEAELLDGYTVARYQQRGLDPTTARGPYDLVTQAQDVVNVLDGLGWPTATVIGHSFGGHLLLHVIADRIARNEPVRFVTDQVGTPTFSADLARALATFARRPLGGIWHIANRGTTSWFTVAEMAAREFGAAEGFVTPIVTTELSPAPAATRPSRSDLSTEKWESAGYAPMPEWTDGLARFARDQ